MHFSHKSRLRMGAFGFAVLTLLSFVPGGQPQDFSAQRIIRVESSLVAVPVMVWDAKGKIVSGLAADSFRLHEDGVRVPVSVFLTSEDPIKIALLLDTSISAKPILGKIRKAARKFLLQLRRGDSAMIAGFDSEIRQLCPFSSDLEELKDAIDSARSTGALTKMRDAAHHLLQYRLRSISGRKAVILLTDGQDHGSRISKQDLLDEAAASGTIIYSVYYTVDPQEILKQMGLSSRIPRKTARKEDGPYASWYASEKEAERYLQELSELSAGRFYRSKAADLDDAFKQIMLELRSQYLIGFYPDDSKLDGSVHSLEVEVAVPGAVVRSRRSYRAVSAVE